MIIGAQKSGTTSIAFHLSQHPEVCFCKNKEPDFFSRWSDWEDRIDEYHNLFNHSLDNQILGEASTMYTMAPEIMGTWDRIYQYNPQVKLIYIMRDPVERIISNYAHRFVRKRISKELENEVFDNPSYVDRSRYFYQISPYIDKFGISNIYLNTFEQFIETPQELLIEIARFLNINTDFYSNQDQFDSKNQSANRKILPDFGKGRLFGRIKSLGQRLPEPVKNSLLSVFGNSIPKKPVFPETVKKELYERTLDDRKQLEALLGGEIKHWKKY